MRHKKIAIIVMTMFLALFSLTTCFGVQLHEKKEALELVFGKDATIIEETKTLSAEDMAIVKNKLGGRFYYIPKDASYKMQESNVFKVYFVMKNGQKAGAAIIDDDYGKWGVIKFIIGLDLNGAVTRVEVMNSAEKRGQPISRHSFLSQFERKTSKNQIEIDKDIIGITGATISSECAAFAVKKAVVLFHHVYLR